MSKEELFEGDYFKLYKVGLGNYTISTLDDTDIITAYAGREGENIYHVYRAVTKLRDELEEIMGKLDE